MHIILLVTNFWALLSLSDPHFINEEVLSDCILSAISMEKPDYTEITDDSCTGLEISVKRNTEEYFSEYHILKSKEFSYFFVDLDDSGNSEVFARSLIFCFSNYDKQLLSYINVQDYKMDVVYVIDGISGIFKAKCSHDISGLRIDEIEIITIERDMSNWQSESNKIYLSRISDVLNKQILAFKRALD
ncbi:MAG: hypothetical protein OCD76_06360 [Reichenbachiella sp.]